MWGLRGEPEWEVRVPGGSILTGRPITVAADSRSPDCGSCSVLDLSCA